MNKAEKLAAFNSITDTDILSGNKKSKQIVKMFLRGMTYKEIAAQFELSTSRIGQLLDRQAKRAIFYKNNKLLLDYAISLTHLYGIVHKDKVVEIYNRQNNAEVNSDTLAKIARVAPLELRNNFVVVFDDYFVEETIIEYDEFEEQLRQRIGKPFYVPEQEELLKYKEESYHEITKQYKALLNYLSKNIFKGDFFKAENLCSDIQGTCQYDFSMENIIDVFNRRNVIFKNRDQVSEVMQLVIDLANNTRLCENNGHTPEEILNITKRPNLAGHSSEQAKSSKKVGRNDPCLCGSGKKYKKCCAYT
ncbi:SEC-C metal-binding domain-containing protein [Heliorestis convoluta]|uniref:SEC-C motif-containing protein n=1 Tax=Heliorestis convoluta TaxID=356322 RepID=A0A5Q2N596_9FIRM|nr:SEC-C metal-binding domain-containing protein [Heliorestis convoluta]QGG48482.1 SEC-C motif-containing protein [Heliorestis convoluta]